MEKKRPVGSEVGPGMLGKIRAGSMEIAGESEDGSGRRMKRLWWNDGGSDG